LMDRRVSELKRKFFFNLAKKWPPGVSTGGHFFVSCRREINRRTCRLLCSLLPSSACRSEHPAERSLPCCPPPALSECAAGRASPSRRPSRPVSFSRRGRGFSLHGQSWRCPY